MSKTKNFKKTKRQKDKKTKRQKDKFILQPYGKQHTRKEEKKKSSFNN